MLVTILKFRSQGQIKHHSDGKTFYNNGLKTYNKPIFLNQPRFQPKSEYLGLRSIVHNQNFQKPSNMKVYNGTQNQKICNNQGSFKIIHQRSKTPDRSDGFWMDVPVIDEYGKPKTIKAWVPQTN